MAQDTLQIDDLKSRIEEVKKKREQEASEACEKYWNSDLGLPIASRQLKIVRTLKGHFGKVYAGQWGGDDIQLVSASQDGKLILWNALTTNKLQAIPLRSSWVMTCAMEQTTNKLVACGGLDNVVSVFNVNTEGNQVSRATKELSSHDGYISCCRFIGPTKIVSSSGDSTVILWDVEKEKTTVTLKGHQGDVMSVAPNPQDVNVVATGSTDYMVKTWDVRSGQCIMTFRGHDSDVNAVAYFPDGFAIGSGGDDSTCRLFDARALCQTNVYQSDAIVCGITSVAFSRSGRLLFAGYDDYSCGAWDVPAVSKYMKLTGHENRVSCLGVNNSGTALFTGSWDTLLKVWA